MPEAPIGMADPHFDEADRALVREGVEKILSGALSMGPTVAAFEKDFAALAGTPHAIAVNSCTSALEASLAAFDLRPGDEVIVPSLTFVATAMAVHLAGGKPVFAELDPATLALDPASVARAATPRTRGVILVHFAGLLTPAVEPLREWCREKGFFLIEDCAHAVGARWKGTAAGAWGEIGCFSLFPTKVLTAGEGGVAVTNDERLAKALRSLQHRGRDLDAPEERYARPGRNIRMTELAALLGRVQLGRLPGLLEARRRVAAAYDEVLAGTAAVPVAPPEPGASAYWKYAFLVPPGADRDGLMAALREAGLLADPGYRPLVHLQPVFRSLYGGREGQLPVTEATAARLICLPCHPRVEVARATGLLRSALARLGGAR